jgi:hypothetical protein
MSDTLLQQTTPADAGQASGGQAGQTQQTQGGFIGADGGFAEGWLDKLPGDLDPYKPTLAKYKDFGSLAKSHGELQQLLGKKSSAVNVPGEKSTPEEIAAFRKALGVPEKPEEYSFKPDKLPDGVAWDDNSAKAFAAIAHKHHIPASAMKELAAHQIAMEEARSQEAFRQMETELLNGKQQLQSAWGQNFERNLNTAARVAKSIGLDPESPGLRDPAVVQALFKVSQITSEDKLVSPTDGATNMPGKLRAQDVMTNKQNPLYERYQNGDSEIVQLVRDMLRNG